MTVRSRGPEAPVDDDTLAPYLGCSRTSSQKSDNAGTSAVPPPSRPG
jgi:hypothetical protein